ncbi:hypothetical protein [Mesorhizobium sp. WSM2239]|uniref:Uncharacterized protein n=2 Tax=unclassified Mesorhizobium TaxID=325217 RepID=A0AAU8DI51_9HYPH
MAVSAESIVVGVVGALVGALATAAVIATTGDKRVISSDAANAETRLAEIKAAIATDPSLCQASGIEIPSAEEAQAAFRKAKGETFPDVQLTLGQCDEDTIGPGAVCMSRVLWGPTADPAERLVGFSKSPDGWVAILY